MQIPLVAIVFWHSRLLGNGIIALKTYRLIAGSNALENQVTFLTHAKGAEAVKLGKCLFCYKLAHSKALLVSLCFREGSKEVFHTFTKHTCRMDNVGILISKLFHWNGVAISPNAIVLLKQLCYVLHQQVLG